MAVSTRALRAHQAVGLTATRSSSAQKVVPLATTRSNGRTTIASAGSVFLGASVKAPVGFSVARASTRALRLETRAAGIADFTAGSIDGKSVKLSKYEGKVCLVVNVASA